VAPQPRVEERPAVVMADTQVVVIPAAAVPAAGIRAEDIPVEAVLVEAAAEVADIPEAAALVEVAEAPAAEVVDILVVAVLEVEAECRAVAESAAVEQVDAATDHPFHKEALKDLSASTPEAICGGTVAREKRP
jgi:hypothetical protein